MSWALKVEAEARKAVEGAVRNKPEHLQCVQENAVFGVNGKHIFAPKTGQEEEQAISVQSCRAGRRGI